MGEEHGDIAGPERRTEFLDLLAGVAEDQTLLAAVQGGDHLGGVGE